ncbi:Fasciclin-like arabinogalactan protein 17 [Striga hermonthica]|uniref:Fasciclin-like arabinogalactan protein 17 n=1 Tax=Striga hermonthica TaxID=68872 RepID=A0A9N7MXP6_STRHE|nr:Fasciclin-like arabinogalactan protein 17 [Striga hermonthica]
MDSQIYGVPNLLILLTAAALLISAAALPENATSKPSSAAAINSNSILVALLDSRYTELAELVEKALLLETLERAVSEHNITIFAPQNEALDRDLDPEFKRFLLEPRNLRSLQNLLLFHMIPTRLEARRWPADPTRKPLRHASLCPDAAAEKIPVSAGTVGPARIIRPDDVSRPDGVIHGIERLLVPRAVQHDFNARRSLRATSAVIPEGAPEVDPRTHRLKKLSAPVPAGSPPALPIFDAMAPGPSLAPAPAPGPGGAHHHFDGAAQVKDFIQTLLHYGGYNELADILVNLTSLASEMGKLVSEGYVLTVLAPNDEAMAKLTTDQLSDGGAPENIIYYHIIPEYQTEESMYNAVRRFGTVNYDTLRIPHKVAAVEADGSVQFGSNGSPAYLLDPDIYTDGRISVQGIDNVLLPPESTSSPAKASPVAAKIVAGPRRGKLLEMACTMLGVVGQDSHFSSCH